MVTDRVGNVIYGGDVGELHSNVRASVSAAGRGRVEAEVTLEAKRAQPVLIYVTGWSVIDSGFSARLPTTSRYASAIRHECGG